MSKNLKKGKEMQRVNETTRQDRAKLSDLVNKEGWKYCSNTEWREWKKKKEKKVKRK